jgi:phospholipid/cholesterol/gamma-HCH transport system substrate-binding protein
VLYEVESPTSIFASTNKCHYKVGQMSPYKRNVILGATVILGLGILGWMILQFGGNVATLWGPQTILVRFVTDRADGVADGSPIFYLGVDSGHVTRVWIDEESKQRVFFEATVNREPVLPSNVRGLIRTASLLGAGSAVSLEVVGPPSSEPLQEGQLVEARFVGLGDMLPAEFGGVANELSGLIKEFREAGIVKNINTQVTRAGELISSMHQIVGDPESQADLKTTIASLRELTDSAKQIAGKFDRFADELRQTSTTANDAIQRAGNNIESLSRQMGDRLTQVARLVDQFQSIAEKVEKGQGTAGALVNDPKLYQSLVDTSRELNLTIKDLQRLVQQWEQEGVTLKLK